MLTLFISLIVLGFVCVYKYGKHAKTGGETVPGMTPACGPRSTVGTVYPRRESSLHCVRPHPRALPAVIALLQCTALLLSAQREGGTPAEPLLHSPWLRLPCSGPPPNTRPPRPLARATGASLYARAVKKSVASNRRWQPHSLPPSLPPSPHLHPPSCTTLLLLIGAAAPASRSSGCAGGTARAPGKSRCLELSGVRPPYPPTACAPASKHTAMVARPWRRLLFFVFLCPAHPVDIVTQQPLSSTFSSSGTPLPSPPRHHPPARCPWAAGSPAHNTCLRAQDKLVCVWTRLPAFPAAS